MDLVLFLADTNLERGKILRTQIRELAASEDFTYRLFAVSLPGCWDKITLEDWKMMGLAMVSMDFPDAKQLGERIYASNPFCRLIYLGEEERSVVPMLPSRPVRYLDTSLDAVAMRSCLKEEYEALRQEMGWFTYEDRYQLLCLPFSGIRYFVSRDRAVYCATVQGERGPLRRTLDQIENGLEMGAFLRCHKSFLVRRDICVAMDKRDRELVLENGERLPISRSCWETVAGCIMSKC